MARRYNLNRFNLELNTPRTTRYNRRRREDTDQSSSDDSADNQRWRDDYHQVANILQQVYNASDSSESDMSHLSIPSGSDVMSIQLSNETDNEISERSNEAESLSLSSDEMVVNNNIDDSSGHSMEDERLFNEEHDEFTSDEDGDFFEEPDNMNISDNPLEEMLNNDDANEILNAHVNLNKAEILLAVLKFSLVYKLPQSAIADLFKMLNIFFNTSVLPQSRYLINQIFNFENNINYHALCPNCKGYVRQFFRQQDPNAHCDPCNLDFSVTDPTYRDFFCIMNTEEEISYYLEENWQYYQSVVEARAQNPIDINEFYSGLLYQRLRNLLPADRQNQFVTATFNSDGSPVFQSSAFSIWPIQIIINELPFKLRTSKPIVCGLWFGRKKPNMNMFLEPFVTQMNVFSDEGLTCKVQGTIQRIYVYAICSCDDSVARAPMQGITQFNGYFGCNWCLHPGYYIAVGRGGSVKYILLDEPLQERNQADTIRDAREAVESGHAVNGVINESVLTHLTHFDIISGFVPDPMHCIDLGVGKQFAKYWLDTSNMPFSLTNAEIDQIDTTLKAMKVPMKVMRNCRSLRDRKFWKAKEYQNWILFYSVVVLLMVPRMRIYAIHWSYFVKAYYILLQSNITREQLRESHRLLTLFVALTEFYYGRGAMTYNVHQLLHVVQSVINWGSLYHHSGYVFENGNGEIVKIIHAAKGVQYQICRMMGMKRSDRILTKFLLTNKPDSEVIDYVRYLDTKQCAKVLTTNIGRYFGVCSRPTPEWSRLLNLSDAAIVYKKLVKSECAFSSCHSPRQIRTNNSYATTSDNSYIQIDFFIIDRINGDEYTICKTIDIEDVLEDEDINQFQIKRIVAISENLGVINTNTLDKICVHMNCPDTRYLCPVPNMYSY